METISFTMIPSTVGTSTSGSSSSYLVSDGNYTNSNWWFDYNNTGDIHFGYNLCANGTCRAYATDMGSLHYATSVNQPYFVVGTLNYSSDALCLSVNGLKGACISTGAPPNNLDEPATGSYLSLYIGNGFGTTAGTQFNGIIYGLSMNNQTIASPTVIDQMMAQNSVGAPLASGYWYPMLNNITTDQFGYAPNLTSTDTQLMNEATQNFWSPSTWNSYYSIHPSPYTVSTVTVGDPAPSLNVKENASVSSEQYIGNPDAGVMLAPIDLSQWNRSNALLLSFNYQASSSYDGPSNVTNFVIQIYDTQTFDLLYSNTVGFPNTTNTGWGTYVFNIGNVINGQITPPGVTLGNNIVVFIGVVNHWQTDWNQSDWFDNLQLYVPSQSPFYALSLGRYNPTSTGNDVYSVVTGGAVQIPNYTPPSSDFFMSTWFEPFNVSSGAATILANDNPTSTNKGFSISYASGGTSITGCLGTGSSHACDTVPAQLKSNTLYFTAMYYASNTIYLWLYYPNSSSIAYEASLTGGNASTGSYPVTVGYNPATGSGYFAGMVSDLRIWSGNVMSAVSPTLPTDLFLDGPTSSLYAPNSLWMSFAGQLGDNLGSGITAVPVVNSNWSENLVSFVAEP
ncbi:MAG: hypothetical protein JRN15_08475 [Nitrososphaerota archaeon]|nr:hypothetical protein [Nitrososphaerota archaeon]